MLAVGEPTVTVIEYGDLQCPVCGRFARDTYPTIKAEYIDTGKVKWVFRHFPLRTIHPRAEAAAQASECASAQGRFFEFIDLVQLGQPALSDDDFRNYATQLQLDVDAFSACVADGSQAVRVQRDVDTGEAAGVSGTPTFFIDGQKVVGFQTVDQMRTLLNAALGN